MIDWVVGSGTNGRVLASTPACAPRRVRLFRTTLLALVPMKTCSAYKPGQTLIVSPGLAAATAALIVVKAAVVRSLQLVALANPSSSTTSVAAWATAPCPPIATRARTAPSATPKAVSFRIARLLLSGSSSNRTDQQMSPAPAAIPLRCVSSRPNLPCSQIAEGPSVCPFGSAFAARGPIRPRAGRSPPLLRGHDGSTLTHLVASGRASAHARQSQQSACPRGSVLLVVAAVIGLERTAEPSASEQVAVRASETAVRGAQDQRRSAKNRNRRGAEKVGCSCMRYGADTMALLP